MAWLSVGAGLLFPLLILSTDSAQLGALAASFYMFIGAVVGAYMGFSTMDDKWHRRGVYHDRDDYGSDYGSSYGSAQQAPENYGPEYKEPQE